MTRPTPVLAGLLLAATLLLPGGTALAAPAATDAAAQGELAWSVRPADNAQGAGRPNFAYELDPGAVVEDALVVTNLGAVPLDLAVYAADGYTTPSGHLDLLPDGETSLDLGAWVTSPVTSIHLDGAQTVEVPFTITVPADASPGDHPGGIVTSSVQAGDGEVRLDRRLGSRIHVRVAGETTLAVEVGDVVTSVTPSLNPLEPPAVSVAYTVTNTGNVRAVVTAATEAGGLVGSARAVAERVELMPGSSLPVEVDLVTSWLVGPVDVDVHVTPEGIDGAVAEASTASASVVSVPWASLAVVAIVVAAAVFLGVRRARRTGA
ncbi:DUF916 domain-containing protein [Serinibacter arcticus]|uniref:DUF916 domain-containing protein n=1 Tax=Serinibacter arcticus TaxID=1655435 RepID=A0A2U1ZTK6_9MICO|nr:DUF916 domain-containing protein [Serinibacter arcticus]PWD50291.1 DUF916 domain-containing protein [Serinibacter arcticus]